LNYLYSVDFTSTSKGFAGGMFGTLLKTVDGGTHWTAFQTGTTATFSSIHFPDAATGYAVGDQGTILKTINGGSYWYHLTSGTTNALMSVYFSDPDTGYVSGIYGTLMKTTNGGGFAVGQPDLSPGYSQIYIYPNPTSGQITVETIGNECQGLLSVMSVDGLALIICQVTEPKTVIDLTPLPCGVYVARYFSGKTVWTGKIMKL
jgi:hypothetical protein